MNGRAKSLKFEMNAECEVKSAIRPAKINPPIANANIPFCHLSAHDHPPASIITPMSIITAPRMNCQFELVSTVVPQRTSVPLSPISPTMISPGPTAMVANAIPKNALESMFAKFVKSDEIMPTAGCSTRLTIT